MEKEEHFLPKPGGVEQIDSDDDMYDNPDEIESPHSNPRQEAVDNKISTLPSTTHETPPSALELNNNNNNSSISFNKYTIIQSRDENTFSSTTGDFVENVIKIHNLNLNDRKQRLILLCILLFIWCVPTLILSLDFYYNNDNQQSSIPGYSLQNNKVHLSSMIIILISCLFLLLFEVMEFRHSIISFIIGLLFIGGGCVHFAGTIVFAHDHCRNSMVTSIDNKNSYCYIGYIGSSNLGALIPIILGIDVIMSILNNKHVRTIIFSFILFISTLCNVITITKYGNGFGSDFGSIIVDNQLFAVISIGYWLLCIASFIGMVEIFIAIYILHFHKFKFDRLYMKIMNLFIGFILILSVSFILIEKNGCITGEDLTNVVFCYYRLTYVLVGLTCVVSYELQTLS